jgi:amidohydrolase family protein
MQGKIAVEEHFVTPELKGTDAAGIEVAVLSLAAPCLQDEVDSERAVAHARAANDARLRENFYLTTNGNFHTPSLIGAILQVGADRILFAADYPFEQTGDVAARFDAAPISEPDRRKVGRTNAEQLFGF